MIQPTAAEPPLVVVQEDLDAYERSVPALKGIGSILLEMNLVTLDESPQVKNATGPSARCSDVKSIGGRIWGCGLS